VFSEAAHSCACPACHGPTAWLTGGAEEQGKPPLKLWKALREKWTLPVRNATGAHSPHEHVGHAGREQVGIRDHRLMSFLHQGPIVAARMPWVVTDNCSNHGQMPTGDQREDSRRRVTMNPPRRGRPPSSPRG